MASISKQANGHRTIQFVAGDGKRRSIRLGKVTQKQAESLKSRVETLNAAKIMKCPLDADTARWVADLDKELAEKLAAVGLIASRESSTLGDFLADYMKKRTDVKERTRLNLEACQRRLLDFFKADRSITSITPGDADEWVLWLRERYASSTAGRAVKRAKQFFKAALRRKLIESNPFEDVKPPKQVNDSRKHFITLDVTKRVLDACPDAEWRLIVALCRFGGLRCPSELLLLRWDEVNWEQGKFLVHSPKTEHHEGGDERWVPIFPELRPYLEESFELAADGAVHLITRYRNANQNLRTQLLRIIKKAGVAAWPKLFHNLRATRETELAASYPLHIVCEWIGNSAVVAQKHYLQVTDADFAKASKTPTTGLGIDQTSGGGAKSGAEAVQIPVQSKADSGCQEKTQESQILAESELVQLLTAAVHNVPSEQVPLRGLETFVANPFPHKDLQQVLEMSGAQCGAVENASAVDHSAIRLVVMAILSMPAEDRLRMAQILANV